MTGTMTNQLDSFYTLLFDEIESRLALRNSREETESSSFWAWGYGMTPLIPVHRDIVMGGWQAEARIKREETGMISLLVSAHELRAGLLLPKDIGEKCKEDLKAYYNGHPADILRFSHDRILVDRIFKEAPFTPDFFMNAIENPFYRKILAHSLFQIITLIWEGALNTIASQIYTVGPESEAGVSTWNVVADKPVPRDIVKHNKIIYERSAKYQDLYYTTIRTGLDEHQIKSIMKKYIGENFEIRKAE